MRWPDGSVSAVPVVTAASAYAEFSKPAALIEEECPAKGCRPLRVTGVKLGDLLLRYGYGACDTIHGARAYETDDLVVVDVNEEGSGGACILLLKTATISVTLARPLGDRLVLDSGTGLPVVPGVKGR